MFKTAIVILNWNGLAYLKKYLGDVVRYSADKETVVCVADNGSTDGSADWVAENFVDVKLIRLEKNHGFAGGYNLALKELDTGYFVLINSDIQVTKGWLDPLINHMDNNQEVAACQPKILSCHQRDHFEYAGAAGGFIDKYGYAFCRGRIFNKVEKDNGQYDNEREIFWSSGACMVVRAEAWKKCRGFDSDFFAHMEEIDLCWRFHDSGYRVIFIPQSVVYHVGGGTLPYISPYKTYLNFRNNLFLLYKNLPDSNLHSVLFIRKLLDGMAALAFLFKGNIKSTVSVLKAHKDYYRNIRNLKQKRKMVRELQIRQTRNLILNKSIIFEFYIKKHKTFSSLNFAN